MKKLIKGNQIKNDHGSIMSVALIVVAILTFSLTSITVLTVNLASNTTNHLNLTTEENEAKALITEAVNQFETFITLTEDIDNFNNTEISRIKAELDVDVLDITSSKPNFGIATNNAETYAYKFSVTLSTGRVVFLEVYVSTYGSTLDSFAPFEFSLATSGDLILNGGIYNDAKLYGNRVMISDYPYFYDELYEDWRALESEFPLYSYNGSLTSVYSNDYNYCDDNNCWSVTGDTAEDSIIMRDTTPNVYDEVWGSSLSDKGLEGDMIITDFFTSFDFDTYFFEYVQLYAPTNDRQLPNAIDWNNIESEIRAYTDDYYFDDVTGANYNRNRTFRDSSVYDGDLTITQNIAIRNESDALIILGDLIFNSSDNLTSVKGNFVVLGNLIFNGDTLNIEGSFFVQGETIINMNNDEGIVTNGNNYGLTILSKDNIRFQRMFVNEGMSGPENLSNISAFMLTEESIEIDAIHSIFLYEGSLFAQALGNSLNPIQVLDEGLTEVNGIVVNSYTGYLYPYDNWWSGISYYYAVPSTDEDNTRFQINNINHTNYEDSFANVPTFDSVFSSDGYWTFETSEFGYE
ncbi:MAG: hypothetical protein QM489_01920 [Candidatus Izemoplasma sp.]